MSFRCQNCYCQSQPGQQPIKLVTEFRDVEYTNEEGKVSQGLEPAKEIVVCDSCVGLWRDLSSKIDAGILIVS